MDIKGFKSLITKSRLRPSAWCSTNRNKECSIYTIGLIVLQRIEATAAQAFAAVLKLSEDVSPKWG